MECANVLWLENRRNARAADRPDTDITMTDDRKKRRSDYKKKEIIQERGSEILPALKSPTYNAGKTNALCSATERNWDIWTEIEQLEVQSGLVRRVWSIDTDIGE